jgi:hypothetical protein
MNNFYRVENGRLIKAPKSGLKVFIGNPTEEHYRFFGYTDEIIEDEMPIVEEGYYLEEHYEQIDGIIYKRYNVIKMEADIEMEVSE